MRRRAAGTRYVWLVCGTAVLGLDILSSLIPQRWGLGYATLRRVAIILYFCAGVGGGRIAAVGAGALAGAVTALVDATLGRTIAGAMGARPDPPPARSDRDGGGRARHDHHRSRYRAGGGCAGQGRAFPAGGPFG